MSCFYNIAGNVYCTARPVMPRLLLSLKRCRKIWRRRRAIKTDLKSKDFREKRKILSTKSWRRRRRIPLLFGLAESTAADFSQTPLKISHVSLMVLLALHAVVKCVNASCRPAFMGGLSPILYRLIVPARYAENITNFGATKYCIGVQLKFIDFFSQNYSKW
jgi:hypothetical protein